MTLYEILVCICATIQTAFNDLGVLAYQPIWFVATLINDIKTVWFSGEKNEGEEETAVGEGGGYPKPTVVKGFHQNKEE